MTAVAGEPDRARPDAAGPDGTVAERVGAAVAAWRPGARVTGLRRLEGGVSSLTYAAVLDEPGKPGLPVVVKIAPPGVAPIGNRDVLRQARLLTRLGSRPGIAVPAVVFTDAGDPPLFAMGLASGECWEPLTNPHPAPPPATVVDRRARAAARMLAALQAIRPADLGLAGEPCVGPRAEVERWARLLATVPPETAPGHEALRDGLLARVPAPLTPTLVHGDYRLGNILFDGAELTAVIDWEIWSLGDPRADLAWLLMHADPAHRFTAGAGAGGIGMPTAADLLAEYRAVRPGPVDDLGWFLACCHYKVASTVAVLVKRNRRRPDPDPAVTTVGATLPAVIARGAELLAA